MARNLKVIFNDNEIVDKTPVDEEQIKDILLFNCEFTKSILKLFESTER